MSTQRETGETTDNASSAAGQGQVGALVFKHRLYLIRHFQPLVEPAIFIFNVGRTRCRQISAGPWREETLLQCFTNALRSINSRGYIVHGATYSHESAYIFIDTVDELWGDGINIREQ